MIKRSKEPIQKQTATPSREKTNEQRLAKELIQGVGQEFIELIDTVGQSFKDDPAFGLAKNKVEESMMWAIKGIMK
jgi:hypothetical protein